jgi:hypothetical protein
LSSPSCRFPSQVKRLTHTQDARLRAHLRFWQPWRPLGASAGCRLYLAFRCLGIQVASWLPIVLLPEFPEWCICCASVWCSCCVPSAALLIPACGLGGNRQAKTAPRAEVPSWGNRRMNARHVALYLWWTIEHVWSQRVALSRVAAEPFLSRRRGERVSVRLRGGSVKAKASSGPNRIRPPAETAAPTTSRSRLSVSASDDFWLLAVRCPSP